MFFRNGYPEFCWRVTPGFNSRKLSELIAPHLRCFESCGVRERPATFTSGYADGAARRPYPSRSARAAENERFTITRRGAFQTARLPSALWKAPLLACHRAREQPKTNASQCGEGKLLCAHAPPTT